MEKSVETARSSPARRVVATILCFAIVLATGFMIIRFVSGPLRPEAQPRPKAEPEEITAERLDQILESDTIALRTVRAFRANYPNEYWAMLRREAARGNPQNHGLFFEMRTFADSKIDALAGAPDADLLALAAANAEAYETMQRVDVGLCARYFGEGIQPGDRPTTAIAQAIDRTGELRILASRHGEDSGAPPRPPLSEEDRQAWLARMRAIDAEAAALIQSGLETAPDEAQCRTAVAYFRAAAELPPELSARFTANFVRGTAPPN